MEFREVPEARTGEVRASQRILDGAINPAKVEPLVSIHSSSAHAASAVAAEIVDLIEDKPEAVLGLATGGTMVQVYRAVVETVRARGVDCSGIRTFNLDEYLGLAPGDERSFRAFMARHLFEPLGLRAGQINFPDEVEALEEPSAAARSYEDAICAAGGIDLQLLGLGRNGHVAFNEPGSPVNSRTRVVELADITRADAAKAFEGVENTPARAITMGMATVLEARALRVLAFGASKAEVVRQLLRSAEDPASPCTYLRFHHDDVQLHVDGDAAQLITPWGR
ncbi:MAG: glucosamine-6-phosphate deaminase [Planctomycetota bacterium]